MLQNGPARKVTIYVNADTRHHLQPLWSAIFEFLHHKRVAGANVCVPHVGFGGHERIRRADSPEVPDPAVRIEFIDTPARVDEILPTLYDMVSDGMIEIQETTIVKAIRRDRSPAKRRAHTRVQGPAKMMRIFLGESDRWRDEPLYDAIVKKLRMMDIAGATVYKGVLGYGAKGHTHKAGLLHLSHDLPVMISIVDTASKIKDAADAIEEMLTDGLIVFSDVEAIRLIHQTDEAAKGSHD